MNATTATLDSEPTRVELILRNGQSIPVNVRHIAGFPAAVQEHDGFLVFENDYKERILVRSSAIDGFLASDRDAVAKVDELWPCKQPEEN